MTTDDVLNEAQAVATSHEQAMLRRRREEWAKVQAAVPKEDMANIMALVKAFDAKVRSVTTPGGFTWNAPQDIRRST